MPPQRKFLTLVERVKVIELNTKNAHLITAKTCTAFPSFTFIFGIMKYNM